MYNHSDVVFQEVFVCLRELLEGPVAVAAVEEATSVEYFKVPLGKVLYVRGHGRRDVGEVLKWVVFLLPDVVVDGNPQGWRNIGTPGILNGSLRDLGDSLDLVVAVTNSVV